MRSIMIVASLLSTSLLQACDKSGEVKSEPSATVQAAAASKINPEKAALNAEVKAALVPRIGGSIVSVGAHQVEIALHQRGLIEGDVRAAGGVALAEPEKAKLAATVNTKAGAKERVELEWVPAQQRFVGKAKAQTELSAGPVEVELALGAKPEVATLASAAILIGPAHGGALMAAGEYSVEVVNQEGLVLAYVMDASGKAVADADVRLHLGGEGAAETQLKWDAPSASYQAKLDAALDMKAQPVRVAIDVGGRSRIGGMARFDANAALAANTATAAKANANVNAKTNANANAKLKAEAPDVNAKASLKPAAAAQANLKASAPTVSVKAPQVKTQAKSEANKAGSASAKVGFSIGTK